MASTLLTDCKLSTRFYSGGGGRGGGVNVELFCLFTIMYSICRSDQLGEECLLSAD